jgi:hypothetical protein
MQQEQSGRDQTTDSSPLFPVGHRTVEGVDEDAPEHMQRDVDAAERRRLEPSAGLIDRERQCGDRSIAHAEVARSEDPLVPVWGERGAASDPLCRVESDGPDTEEY